MDPNTFPTKGNLILAKNSLALSLQGFDLMDKKRNILIREMMNLIDEAKGIQSQIDVTFREAYGALQRANMEIGINTDFHICPLQRSIRLTEGHIDLRLDTLRLIDQVHHFTDQNISLLIHQVKSLERKSQRILGKDQISLGREGIWIHKIPPFIPS